ncbi:MAG: hypothetical protein IK066_01660, partial [Kiritimatiellae bacterium]|nr:hypothetical protein [Kiritimatiellia bacterium]
GGGGGGGGGGGSGSTVVTDNSTTYYASSIHGGKGGDGKGGDVGGGSAGGSPEPSSEHSNYNEKNKDKSWTGAGGAGGNGNAQGSGGKLVVLPTAALTCFPSQAADTGAALPQEEFLKVKVTLDLGLTDAQGKAVTLTFEQPFACRMVPLSGVSSGGVEACPKRVGYRFAGYWLDDGTCVYGPDGKATMVMSPFVADYTLRARWEVDGSILNVTSSGDGASTLGVYGNEAVTLRDAVEALAANPLLVGEDGRRRVTFGLAETDTVVRLTREIAVPAGVRAFEINGLYGLTNGVRLAAGSGARHFRFAGAAEKGAPFTLASLTFTGGNPTRGAGGAILAENGASVLVEACSFLKNRAGQMQNGGAICVVSGESKLLVDATTFAGNSAQSGGAVHVDGADSAFVNTTFSGNSAKASGGGISTGKGAPVELLACTFAGNTAAQRGPSLASTCTLTNAVRAVNCIFADTAGGKAPVAAENGGTLTLDWCSTDVPPEVAFASGGAAVTQMVAGVMHVVHPPLGGERSKNEDAAEIYRDADYENLLAVDRDGRRVVLAGVAGQATIPFVTDQLSQLRTAPTRGAVRLAVGTEPVTVEIDGVLCDAVGNPRPDATVDTPATVFYDSGEAVETNLTIRTAAGGVFGLSVPVDGSDGLAHNVTGICVRALGPEAVAVATAPYALKAASVDLIASPDYVVLDGDGVAIGNVAAMSISAAKSFDARSAGSFTAGSLKGFKTIDLEHVTVSGGSLKWLGGPGPAEGVTFANLEDMSVGGGVEAFSGTVNVGYSTVTRTWQAEADGFMQLQVRAPSKPAHEYLMVAVNVLNSDRSTAFEVTPRGLFGGADQRALWTIPVCKGQFVQLKLDEDYSDKPAVDIGVHAQFIYFGVEK